MEKEQLAEQYTLKQLRVRSERLNGRQIPVNEALAIQPDFMAGFDAAMEYLKSGTGNCKTAITELISFMAQNQYFIGNDLLEKSRELLVLEKQQIMNAYDTAIERPIADYAEQYYNETFQN